MKKRIRDGTPKKLFMVMTFGLASSMMRKITDNLPEAEEECQTIRNSGGAPKIYLCTLIK